MGSHAVLLHAPLRRPGADAPYAHWVAELSAKAGPTRAVPQHAPGWHGPVIAWSVSLAREPASPTDLGTAAFFQRLTEMMEHARWDWREVTGRASEEEEEAGVLRLDRSHMVRAADASMLAPAVSLSPADVARLSAGSVRLPHVIEIEDDEG